MLSGRSQLWASLAGKEVVLGGSRRATMTAKARRGVGININSCSAQDGVWVLASRGVVNTIATFEHATCSSDVIDTYVGRAVGLLLPYPL